MKRPWMPLYVQDFQMDTLDLTAEQVGVYMLLLMLAWKREGDLPNDMKWLKLVLSRISGPIHGNKFNSLVPPILERYFILGADMKWRNKRLCEELAKAENFSRIQSENGKKRWSGFKVINGLQQPSLSLSQSHIESLKRLAEYERKKKGD